MPSLLPVTVEFLKKKLCPLCPHAGDRGRHFYEKKKKKQNKNKKQYTKGTEMSEKSEC